MLSTREIQIRDPFIVPVQEEGLYYMYGTTGNTYFQGPSESGFDSSREAFDAFCSRDLKEWEGPFRVFSAPPGFWADHHFWAPEVHAYRGRWYMFASFKANDVCRGTQILVSDSLRGPFLPHSDGPVTPRDWECLDGTLFIDDEGAPWMVFCHEWVQVEDGKICAVRLRPDLLGAEGEPVTLFRASEAPWTVANPGTQNRVTDGPFLHRTAAGTLLMLWSGAGTKGYAMSCARSASGTIMGPWIQEAEPMVGHDGGHGMLFRTLEGRLMASLHWPNRLLHERPLFLAVEETEDGLRLA